MLSSRTLLAYRRAWFPVNEPRPKPPPSWLRQEWRRSLEPAHFATKIGKLGAGAATGCGSDSSVGLISCKAITDETYVASRRPDGIFTGAFRQATIGLRWEVR